MNQKCKNEGKTPLHIAAEEDGNKDLIELLLINGAEVNSKNFEGKTALHMILELCEYNRNIISLLIQKGASISAKDKIGNSPFNYLMEFIDREGDDEIGPFVFKEVSKFVFENPSVTQDMDFIHNYNDIDNEIPSYLAEIKKMSSIKFFPPYSYYCVLKMSKNVKKLANLTKEDGFVQKFYENLHRFSHFKDDLQTILDEAVEIRNNFRYRRLISIFGKILPAAVIKKIAENITVKDLPLQ